MTGAYSQKLHRKAGGDNLTFLPEAVCIHV
jgi:hypothetical protein